MKTRVFQPLDVRRCAFALTSSAPLVQYRSPNGCGHKLRDWRDAQYLCTTGWPGIPTVSMREAMIQSMRRSVEFDITIRQSSGAFVVHANGYSDDGIGLISFYSEEVKPYRARVSLSSKGNSMIIERPMYEEWSAIVDIEYDSSVFSPDMMHDLMRSVGKTCGIGMYRPLQGGNFGTFDVELIDATITEHDRFLGVLNGVKYPA